jgi:peroxiredoxin
MTIKVGDRLPDATFRVKTDDGIDLVSAADYFAGKRVVLFGVPGAFTPTCHRNHFPGFLTHHDAIIAKGVDKIAVVSVNDHHVMFEWAKATGGLGKIDFLADGAAVFVTAAGLDADMNAGGMGTRSKRFAAIVDDGVVKMIAVEEKPGEVSYSSAEKVLEELDRLG